MQRLYWNCFLHKYVICYSAKMSMRPTEGWTNFSLVGLTQIYMEQLGHPYG